ncbi:hypothetical protein A1A1_01358 [Planococcus antarcticus DSM 14505]|uniref:Uncharacterized protein n=1 Tax=Planococcus antarcticus DSM 14505 TaxID=1185653 RepID=A0AA87LVC4_9BACL|nr:hypothetical protein [Planococcus antarcticus]EIM08337.1 hypothetical protein A1A1_01358 [Planococcus antarcticus DSM 14505]
MKKFLYSLIVSAMLISLVSPSVSAQSQVAPVQEYEQVNFTEELIEKVNPYIITKGHTYELSNLDMLKEEISAEELAAVEEKIAEMNILLNQNDKIKELDNHVFEVIVTDDEIKEEFEANGNENHELSNSLEYIDKYPTYSTLSTKNGINKVKFHWWGYELWLSKTSVTNILSGGIAATSLVLGLLIPGVGIAIALAVNSFVWSIFAGQKARASYFKYSLKSGIHGFKYQ